MQRKPFYSILILLELWGLAGCQGPVQRHSFPAVWPEGMAQPSAGKRREGTGPAVAVRPMTLDLEGTASAAPARGAGPETSRMLTDLMIEKLVKAGIRVSEDENEAEYVFAGTIPKLGYTEKGGYPRKFYYTSELDYQLIHRPSGTVVWQGKLSQDFDQTVLVNTMTRLPKDPNAPEQILIQKCVGPNWETIAADLSAFLKKRSSAPAG